MDLAGISFPAARSQQRGCAYRPDTVWAVMDSALLRLFTRDVELSNTSSYLDCPTRVPCRVACTEQYIFALDVVFSSLGRAFPPCSSLGETVRSNAWPFLNRKEK